MADSTPNPPSQPLIPLTTISTTTTNRLSLPFPLRLPLLLTFSAFTGMCLGLTHGSQESGLRFRAENSHRLPHSQTGWYLYHKSKNYHMMLGGIQEGFKMSGRLAVWTGVFVVGEELVDRGRGRVVRVWRGVRDDGSGRDGGGEDVDVAVTPAGNRDFVSTLLAGIGTAGAFSVWNGFPLPTAVRLAKTGAKAGLLFGVLQDMVGSMRGRRLGYVEFIKRHTIGTSEERGNVGVAAAATGVKYGRWNGTRLLNRLASGLRTELVDQFVAALSNLDQEQMHTDLYVCRLFQLLEHTSPGLLWTRRSGPKSRSAKRLYNKHRHRTPFLPFTIGRVYAIATV